MKARTFAIAVSFLAVGQSAVAQSTSSSLVGTVFDSDGSVVPDAPVRARNAATGTDARTRSSATGTYSLRDLPDGTYLVTVSMPCCDFDPYINEGVTVEANREQSFDIVVVRSGLNVEGDDPGLINAELRSRQSLPDLPVPRTADGRPDFTGVWLMSEDPYPEQARVLPWAADIAAARIANSFADHPHTRCLPDSPPIEASAHFMAKFVQTPTLIVILSEGTPGIRQIFLDGRAHPSKPSPTWMGHSIGRWEGDTLVVETVGFNDRGWVGIYPRTERLRMEERYRRTDYAHLALEVTFEDPGVFEAPWRSNMTWDFAPQEELMEYVCENNKWAPKE